MLCKPVHVTKEPSTCFGGWRNLEPRGNFSLREWSAAERDKLAEETYGPIL